MLSLLARQRRGLYYNMPLVDGCSGSGLFRAFNRHVLHRLNIKQDGPLLDTFRVTLLERKTRFRQILNLEELKQALQQLPNVKLQVVDFESGTSFENQLRIAQNTDIFIGMHGSGLVHTLFLPEWAVLFELYNCGDEDCYKDLSRLRGVNYLTWTKMDAIKPDKPGVHPTSGEPHEKFANYQFEMSRMSSWGRVWSEIWKSLTKTSVAKKYIGEDKFGNKFYEFEGRVISNNSNVKRGYNHGEDPNILPSVEWQSWLKGSRRFPPSDQEIEINRAKEQAKLAQDAQTESRAPHISSQGKGAADVDRPRQFPSYGNEYEKNPGAERKQE
ncbi:hypothetical protein M3Y97_00740800 [Aphelenchoides bicaudatus]|nr:hypothetical protein M3Y97_00740800 [Aphelenchoides bicaudatus]